VLPFHPPAGGEERGRSAIFARPTGDDGSDFDFVVVLDEFAVGQELVAADYHGGARKDAELGE
jgi:hypothetical protein